MKNESDQIWSYIDTFRESKYFQEVIGQGYLVKWAGIHIEAYLEQEDDEFLENMRELLGNKTMLTLETVEPLLENNSVEDLRNAFSLFLSENIEPIEFIDKFLELENCGVYFASHMLSLATNGDYIIYHKTMYEALIELFPILAGDLEPAGDGVSYMLVQMACDVIIQSYKFTSVQELHEFLWHGKETNWEFE